MTFFYNASENNRIDKNLTEKGTTQIFLKNSNDLLNIEIEIKKDIIDFNYFYIKELKRYYFVTDVGSVNNSVWSVLGSVDVLETYKDSIYNLVGIVDRQSVDCNFLVEDNMYPVRSDVKVVTKKFDSGFDIDGSFILSVIGD